ncbi:MAG: mechanosensitive ion channel domain-containing protein [Opitutaceae bacterium]
MVLTPQSPLRPDFRRRAAAAARGLLAALLLWPAIARAARDDELIGDLQERIVTLKALAAEKTDAAEKQRLEQRLKTLQEELAIVEKRQSIESQERNLQSIVLTQPREQLREQLQAVPADPAAAEARLRDLAARRTQVMAELDELRRQREETRTAPEDAVAVKRAEIEERIFTRNEELRAIALQQESAETEFDLVGQARSLRDRLRTADGVVRLSLRALYEEGVLLHGDSTSGAQLAARIANLGENLRNTEAAADLARQKQEKFDEELKLLAGQTGLLRRNAKIEQFIATERAQKQLAGERLPFLTAQIGALGQIREQLQIRQKLGVLESRFLEERLRGLWAAYLRRLEWPGLVAAGLIALYLAISRLVLPRRYRKEELFLARRLGRYATALLVATVTAGYLIEDLTTLATTLGLVSAAVVISLQDVCASFFAWFVIMLGHKFTIGDRLEIDGTKGDVLDIQLLRTTLIEVNNWLGADQPTGRIIVIPNNLIFKAKVFNYSHGHPYIWGKIDVTVTYGTPVASAMALFTKVLEEETRDNFTEARKAASTMEQRYGVEDADYRPKIYTRIADSGVTFSLFYVSHYRQSSTVRNRINRRLIAELETHRHVQLAYNTLSVLTSQASDGPSAVLGSEATQPPFPIAPKG